MSPAPSCRPVSSHLSSRFHVTWLLARVGETAGRHVSEVLGVAIDAARKAGAVALRYCGGKCELGYRGNDNPVTTADLKADACLRRILLAVYPEYGWLSEETADSTERLDRDRVWIVDPIDGTKEFVDGVPEYVVSVALVEHGVPLVGVIYHPARDELYAGVHGGGAFLNGKRTFCSEVDQLDQASMIVSRSETRRGETEALRPHLGRITPVGNVAYKLALVAAGQADLSASMQPKNEWDVCAGDLLVREAGGEVLTLAGQVRTYNQSDPLIQGGLVAANSDLARQILTVLQEAV